MCRASHICRFAFKGFSIYIFCTIVSQRTRMDLYDLWTICCHSLSKVKEMSPCSRSFTRAGRRRQPWNPTRVFRVRKMQKVSLFCRVEVDCVAGGRKVVTRFYSPLSVYFTAAPIHNANGERNGKKFIRCRDFQNAKKQCIIMW